MTTRSRRTAGDVTDDSAGVEIEINVQNEWAMNYGQNLPNHTATLSGLGKFIKPGDTTQMVIRTRQYAFRVAAWIAAMAEVLPDEAGQEGIEFEQVLDAVRNT